MFSYPFSVNRKLQFKVSCTEKVFCSFTENNQQPPQGIFEEIPINDEYRNLKKRTLLNLLLVFFFFFFFLFFFFFFLLNRGKSIQSFLVCSPSSFPTNFIVSPSSLDSFLNFSPQLKILSSSSSSFFFFFSFSSSSQMFPFLLFFEFLLPYLFLLLLVLL
ncbi:unnamed protein product [Acanthosepion pharaonis]|uniref:Uncharacterized protein n=1 Tax=Acanthosepion pharaonis TaxID=158019 RepID=A0A812C8H2_ACAPH|nr:unnamed protein product [Sepia pharaonis]